MYRIQCRSVKLVVVLGLFVLLVPGNGVGQQRPSRESAQPSDRAAAAVAAAPKEKVDRLLMSSERISQAAAANIASSSCAPARDDRLRPRE